MIASAIARHIPFRYVLNDIWFASAEKMAFIHNKCNYFLMTLKCNRRVALSETLKKQGKWQAIATLRLHKRRWLSGNPVSGHQ
jgi:hypothetical protein